MGGILKIDWGKLILAIFVCLLAGIIGSVFTYPAIGSWYAFLEKPFFAPPNWLFGPAWTTLYFLMGVSLYLVWKTKSKQKGFIALKNEALNIFYTQLALNALWSIIFFGLKSPSLAFVEILLMWVLIAATICKFSKISKAASYLLIPYLLWVSFATLLNASIVYLN